MDNLKRSATRSVIWAYASRYSGKLLVFVSTLVLARLLLQEDFGVAGYALVVIAFLETISGLGIGPALIYQRDEPITRDTGFWLGLGAGLTLMTLTWLGAPLLATFFQDPRAADVSRVLALALPLSALGNIHVALLEKHLQFGKKLIPELTNSVVKVLFSIGFALFDFGAWSLIYGQLAGTAAGVATVWIVNPWRPSMRFEASAAHSLLNYGTRIIAVGILGFLVSNIGFFFVGRFMSAAIVGVYVLALRIPTVLIKESAQVINNVLFPVFTKIKDDTAKLGRGYLSVMRYFALLTVPLGLGLAAVAEPFVLSLLTDKWAEMIPVIRLAAIYVMLLSLGFNAGTVFKAVGRPGLIIRLSLLRLAILLPSVGWAVVQQESLIAVMAVQVGAIMLHLLICWSILTRILQLSLGQLLAVMLPAVTAGIIMYAGVVATITVLSDSSPFLQLLAGVVAGALLYGSVIWVWQRKMLLQGYRQLRSAFSPQRS
ncbi:MAG: lipopolysaccharide biosynthesis protein [Gammaproteobacteria bacterium]|nr:lipopolysaccharide biosynthesis protein [Gammaproteobacteria bacterium]